MASFVFFGGGIEEGVWGVPPKMGNVDNAFCMVGLFARVWGPFRDVRLVEAI